MRVVALEEHFTVPALVKRIDPAAISRRGFKPRKPPVGRPNPMELAPEIGEIRLKSMDEAGITVQVLSGTGPGPDLVPGADGVTMAREMNDHLAAACAKHPARFAGFAALPMQSPDACAAELRRCVKELRFHGALINGTCEGRFLDHPSYDGLLAAAVELDVPIYIHPHSARAGRPITPICLTAPIACSRPPDVAASETAIHRCACGGRDADAIRGCLIIGQRAMRR
jgi:predicted TIM-barrel fold metal-dependent hydrolase